MELENLFCKVETAKRLAKLHLETLYVHHNDNNGWVIPREKFPESELPAFSCGELGVLLGSWANDVHYSSGHWFVCRTDVLQRTMYDTEAEARAQYLIWLLNTKQTDASNVVGRYNNIKNKHND